MFLGDQLITTEAPPKFLSSLNKSLAFCLSNNVLPKKVPRPRPEFGFNSNDLDLTSEEELPTPEKESLRTKYNQFQNMCHWH